VRLAVVLVLVPFAVLLQQVRADGPLARFDVEAAAEVHDWARHADGVVSAARAVTHLGGNPALSLVAVGAAALLWSRRRPSAALFVLLAAVGESVLVRLAKELVGRERPSLPDPVATATGGSFPSGHAMGATAVWGAALIAVVWLVAPRWRRPLVVGVVVLVAAVGLTRVVLGVHYPSDVLAGHVLGAAWLAALMAVVDPWPDTSGDCHCGQGDAGG
jgi:undecaprenyl-diphosphatase